MSRPTHRLRTRLLVAMVAIAFGVLVVAALGAAALARETSADSARHDLERKAPHLAATVDTLGALVRQRPAVRNSRLERTVAELLAASGASLLSIREDGTVDQGPAGLLGFSTTRANPTLLDLPPDLRVRDLDLVALVAGHRQTGQHGDTVYVAEPLTPVGTVTPVLVLSEEIQSRPLGRAGPFLFVTGAVALVAAALVSAYLARRMTRPLAAIETAAGRIAAGDLSARVDTSGLRDDELARLAESFNTMAAEMEAARGHERAFLLSISHDLRTPLTSIKGYAEAIVDGTVPDAGGRVSAARIIESEARRLERLVADLLDLTRLDAHQFSLAPRLVDARAVVTSSVEGFRPSARDLDLRLELVPGPEIHIEADPERLAQIVANLVENALKYARTTVRVDVDRRDGTVELRVDDDGPGIPVDERDRVFERLYTARGAPARAVGTGIGLAIVHELAVAMGGSASCETLNGGGTRFVVTLPA